MHETDTKSFLVVMFVVLFVLVLTGLIKYMPHHLVMMQRRAIYYLWGEDGDERLLWQWLGLTAENGIGGLKEL